MLPLDQWPTGEVEVTASVAGRRAIVYLNQRVHLVTVDIDADSPVALLAFENVRCVEAKLEAGLFKALELTIDQRPEGQQTIILRIYPEIDLRSR